MRKYSILIGLVCFMICSGEKTRLDADIISNFSTGAEGWTIVTLDDPLFDDYDFLASYAVNHQLVGGNPGGYVSSNDNDSGATMFSAPSAYLGNVSAATGLSWDLTYSNHPADYQPSDLILVGNGQRLLWKSNPNIVPTTGWTPVSVTIAPSSAWRLGTSSGAFATAADFQNVLGNLTALYIRGEYTNGLLETSGIDNVILAGVVPEPSGLLVICLMGGTALLMRKRQ